jgi:hypothetical protein
MSVVFCVVRKRVLKRKIELIFMGHRNWYCIGKDKRLSSVDLVELVGPAQ